MLIVLSVVVYCSSPALLINLTEFCSFYNFFVQTCYPVTGLTNGIVATALTTFCCDLCGVYAACNSILEDDIESKERHELFVQIVEENVLVVIREGLALVCKDEVSERRCHHSLRFILDSGASSHMFPCKDLFIELACTVQGKVSLGNANYKLRIVGQGKTTISVLENVLWVPGLSFGLISTSAFDSKGYKIVTEAGKVTVFDEIGEVVLSGTLHNNLYYLDNVYVEKLWGSSKCSCSAQPVTAAAEVGEIVEDQVNASSCKDLDLLHRTLGHPGEYILKKAIRNNNFSDSTVKYEDVKDCHLKFCPSCYEGKMKAFPSPNTSREQEFQLFEKMCIDFKGAFNIKSVHGHIGFYLISDYASGNVFAFPYKHLPDEDSLLETLEEYKSIVSNEKGTIRIIQSDFDSVILGSKVKAWLMKYSIKTQASAPRTHWQNGAIESNIGKVMDKARTIMAAGRAPRRFWNYAILCACYLINRSPVRFSDKTPYELRYGKKPELSHLVPFFSPGVYHLTKEERNGGWDYKGRRCRMLGYDERTKESYFILALNNGRETFLTRHDCKWNLDALEHISINNQNGELDGFDSYELEYLEEDDDDEEEEITEPEIISSESVPSNGTDEDLDEPYWKSSDLLMLETANLLERWLQDVRELALIAHEKGRAAEMFIPKLPDVPRTVEEALEGPDSEKWHEAILKELSSFDDRGVFMEAAQVGRAMKTKMILRTSYRNDYSIKYKARLVACGYSQIYGIDYLETYAPTASTVAVLICIQLAAMQGLLFSEFDVTAAFLEGKNDFPNFARLPKFLGGVRVEVVGNFYGEKQGPKIWNDQLHGILTDAGFTRCPVHPCIYKKMRKDGQYMWIVVHVDDGLILTCNVEMREEFLSYFKSQVQEATHLEVVGRYVGMDFDFFPEQRKVLLSHKLYISQKWDNYNKIESIPMAPTSNLRTAELNPNNPSMLHDTGEFRFMCDRARPDMLVVTGELATGGDKAPSNEHLKVAEKAKHYLKSTMLLGLVLGGLGQLCIFGYADASWVTDGNCKSRLGGCVFMNTDSGAVKCFSKNDTKPSSLSHSSCEAEIKAIDEWVREVMHIKDIYSFLCGPYNQPVKLFVDSLSAIELCTSLRQSHKVKHINMRIHFIREMIEEGFLELLFIPTDKNVADMLTKAIAERIFVLHRNVLLNGHGGVMPRSDERIFFALNAETIHLLYADFGDAANVSGVNVSEIDEKSLIASILFR